MFIIVSVLHRQVDPSHRGANSVISNGMPTDRQEGNQISDPLAKSLVKINSELSRVIKTLGSSSTRSTPIPDQQTPGEKLNPSHDEQIYIPHPLQIFSQSDYLI